MNFKMMTDGQVVDGSWDLVVSVTDLQVEKTLRVRGDLHIGGVMLQLVEALGKYILLFLSSFFESVQIGKRLRVSALTVV